MKKSKDKRVRYSPEFKKQAIELAKELGSSKLAADKLGIQSFQTLAAWVRYDKKITEDGEFRENERLKEENKKLKKQLEHEKKCTAILKDAMAFLSMETWK